MNRNSPFAIHHPQSTIPLSSPDITEREIELVNEVLRTRYLSRGPMLERFEESVADFVGAKHAVGVSSGTAGLHLAMIAAGIGSGDAVITTPFSFVASANCILYVGATPIFVDVDPVTLNLDPALVAQAVDDLSDGGPHARRWLPPTMRNPQSQIRNPKCLLPVHVFGQPCAMDKLGAVADEYGLTVIEDACEAIGAEREGCKAGTLGDAGVFAFYPNKQITTGEGGMLVTDRDEWATLFRSLRNQGRDESDGWLHHVRLGYNYRLDELSAALGVAQMERIDKLLEKRAQVAAWYTERLEAVEAVQVPQIAPEVTRMSWFVYVVRLASEIERDTIIKALKECGIPSRPYFTPLHLQPLYKERFGYREGDFCKRSGVTERVAQSTLALPFFGEMTEAQVARVCEALEETVGTFKR